MWNIDFHKNWSTFCVHLCKLCIVINKDICTNGRQVFLTIKYVEENRDVESFVETNKKEYSCNNKDRKLNEHIF